MSGYVEAEDAPKLAPWRRGSRVYSEGIGLGLQVQEAMKLRRSPWLYKHTHIHTRTHARACTGGGEAIMELSSAAGCTREHITPVVCAPGWSRNLAYCRIRDIAAAEGTHPPHLCSRAPGKGSYTHLVKQPPAPAPACHPLQQ
ncbi:hypothetical protein Vretifemale_1181 [Volvox reticuliferus]|uniref:Uncharacterized protein n=1 Tax=Volvox reticuliferus TaxID=1737510 RepID=A0A8J4FDG3_9CHLO|nr:hypothetical protein Vretifemale_1181 [Volvox reticuliferus]